MRKKSKNPKKRLKRQNMEAPDVLSDPKICLRCEKLGFLPNENTYRSIDDLKEHVMRHLWTDRGLIDLATVDVACRHEEFPEMLMSCFNYAVISSSVTGDCYMDASDRQYSLIGDQQDFPHYSEHLEPKYESITPPCVQEQEPTHTALVCNEMKPAAQTEYNFPKLLGQFPPLLQVEGTVTADQRYIIPSPDMGDLSIAIPDGSSLTNGPIPDVSPELLRVKSQLEKEAERFYPNEQLGSSAQEDCMIVQTIAGNPAIAKAFPRIGDSYPINSFNIGDPLLVTKQSERKKLVHCAGCYLLSRKLYSSASFSSMIEHWASKHKCGSEVSEFCIEKASDGTRFAGSRESVTAALIKYHFESAVKLNAETTAMVNEHKSNSNKKPGRAGTLRRHADRNLGQKSCQAPASRPRTQQSSVRAHLKRSIHAHSSTAQNDLQGTCEFMAPHIQQPPAYPYPPLRNYCPSVQPPMVAPSPCYTTPYVQHPSWNGMGPPEMVNAMLPGMQQAPRQNFNINPAQIMPVIQQPQGNFPPFPQHGFPQHRVVYPQPYPPYPQCQVRALPPVSHFLVGQQHDPTVLTPPQMHEYTQHRPNEPLVYNEHLWEPVGFGYMELVNDGEVQHVPGTFLTKTSLEN